MDNTGGTPREVAVPVSVFGSLRAELAKEAGTLPTVHALHSAGYQAGTQAAGAVSFGGKDAASAMAQGAFWTKVAQFFSERGWGTLRFDQTHSAVGLLTSPDWAEASHGSDPDASCFFSTGFLSGLLSELAGGPVAVLEVGCRTRGEDVCSFAFGSEAAIHDLYGRMLDGEDLHGALAAL